MDGFFVDFYSKEYSDVGRKSWFYIFFVHGNTIPEYLFDHFPLNKKTVKGIYCQIPVRGNPDLFL